MVLKTSNAASKAASLFSRDPDVDTQISGLFSMTVRLPSLTAATVAVMAEHAGQSRNSMLELIINAGIDAILQQTPAPIREEINAGVIDQIENFV